MVLSTEYRVQSGGGGAGEGRDGARKVPCKICDKFFITLRLGCSCFSYGFVVLVMVCVIDKYNI